MAYVFVEDFAAGWDVRRPAISGVPGSLQEAENVLISKGGIIEGRLSLVKFANVDPVNTFGLASVAGRLHVFGTVVASAVSTPKGIIYQQLTSATVTLGTIERILSAEPFDGKLYVIARFTDRSVYHFYDGVHVTAWDDAGIGFDTPSFAGIARALAEKVDGKDGVEAISIGKTVRITGEEDGTSFTASASATDGGSTPDESAVHSNIQAPVAPVAGAEATADVTIQSGSVAVSAKNGFIEVALGASGTGNGKGFDQIFMPDGTPLLRNQIVTGGGETFVQRAAREINNNLAHGVTAQVQSRTEGAGDERRTFQKLRLTGDPVKGAAHNGIPVHTPIGNYATTKAGLTGGVDASAVTSIRIDGEELIAAKVSWDTDADTTAAALAAKITSDAVRFDASAVGAVVTIATKNRIAELNGKTVTVNTKDGLGLIQDSTLTGGADGIPAVPQVDEVVLGGTYDPGDTFKITVNGEDFEVEASAAAAKGSAALTFKGKMNVTVNSLVRYSAVNDPLTWEDVPDPPGAGFQNLSNHDRGSDDLIALGVYNGNLAIFSRDTCQIWLWDQDDDLNQHLQTLKNSGTMAPRSVLNYVDEDTFYLDTTGVRSLRARDSSGKAFATDIGTAIDPVLSQLILANPEDAERAVSLIEPISGRYWLVIGGEIYVFSFFPGAKINAWSKFTFDPSLFGGATRIDDAVVLNDRVYLRIGSGIFIYGGVNGTTYPGDGNVRKRIRLPFLDAGKPAHRKKMFGFNAAIEGNWDVTLLVDPRDLRRFVRLGNITETTYLDGTNRWEVEATHFAPLLESTLGGPVELHNLAVHYQLLDDD